LSSAEPHTKHLQSGHGGLRTIGCASSLNQGDGGGTGLRDGLVAVDGRSEKAYAVESRIRSTENRADIRVP